MSHNSTLLGFICNISTCRYMLARLPEGGEGAFGYDDGEGDD